MQTDLIGYINIFSGISQILLGLFIFLYDPKERVKKYYFLSAFFLGAWSLSLFFYANPIIFTSTIWLKLVYTFAYCMTLGLILFATVYPREENKFKKFFWLIFFFMMSLTSILWFTDWIVVSSYNIPNEFNSIAKMGPLYLVYGIPEFVTGLYIVGYYIKQSKILKGLDKQQIQFYVTGGILMLIPVAIFDFIFPLIFNDTSLYKYSTLGNAVWTGIVGYSIIKTRFLDVRIMISSISILLIKSLLLTISFFLFSLYLSPLLNFDYSFLSFLKILPFFIVLSIILNKLFIITEEFFVFRFMYVNYHPFKTIQKYNRKNSKTLNIAFIMNNYIDTLKSSFLTNEAGLILYGKSDNILHKYIKGFDESQILKISHILDVWKHMNSNRILVYSELKKSKQAGKKMIDKKRQEILIFMESFNIEIILPFIERNRFTGILFLGNKKDNAAYTVTDIDFIDGLTQSTQISLGRALLYQQVEDFNKTLQLKVNEQTKELQTKVVELQEARRKEADMIDIMGHELRTPATIVKLNAELLKKFTEDIDKDPDSYKKHLSRITDAVENEIKLINTLLSSAKLEGDKIELNPEKVDIVKEIEMSINGHEIEAKSKGLTILNNIREDNLFVYADHARTVEILNNLINNAVKYTNRGSITIDAHIKDTFVEISIKDTGAGIPKEDISKLGTKFFRTGNYIEGQNNDNVNIVRPGGTGLGLYVTFNLVKKMGGQITVQSEIGQGSTFTFTLPIYNNQKDLKPNQSSKDMFLRLGLKR